MAQPFQYTTLTAARQQLASRLYDPGMVFWIAAELTLYIQEAMQTWNAYAQYWRGDFVFPIINNSVGYGDGGYGEGGYGGGATVTPTWFDITQATNTLRPYTITDAQLYNIIEYQLLEPANTGQTWFGSSQFGILDLQRSTQRRMDEILTTTGCTIAHSAVATVPGQVRTLLPDNVLDIRRLAWFPSQVPDSGYNYGPYGYGGYGGMVGRSNVMWPEDVWSFQSFQNNYSSTSQGIPAAYAVSSQPQITFDVNLSPNTAGNYDLLTVNAGPTLTFLKPTIIPIPTDFVWVLKWGVLADLLSIESEAKDEMRAAYCNMRYQQGMKLLQNSPALLQLRINGVPIWMDAVRSADEYSTNWQNLTPGLPTNAFIAGLNLIALAPPPDDTGYSGTATVVQNAPIPVADLDYLEVSRGDYNAILDYAQHLALFKNGGAEFGATKVLYDRFVRQASLYNSKLRESGDFTDALYEQSERQEMMAPRVTKQMPTGGDDSNG